MPSFYTAQTANYNYISRIVHLARNYKIFVMVNEIDKETKPRIKNDTVGYFVYTLLLCYLH